MYTSLNNNFSLRGRKQNCEFLKSELKCVLINNLWESKGVGECLREYSKQNNKT